MQSPEIDASAKILWEYLRLDQQLERADCILVSSSNDVRVAEYAADLYLKGYAPRILFSGGKGRGTERWDQPEAEIFVRVARSAGVPEDSILVESTSTNTRENLTFSPKLLEQMGLHVGSIIFVQKPYMMRRARAIFAKQWPDIRLIIAAPPISFEEYANEAIPYDTFINFMVGDLQRIKLYPAIWHAYEYLVSLGYTAHLIK